MIVRAVHAAEVQRSGDLEKVPAVVVLWRASELDQDRQTVMSPTQARGLGLALMNAAESAEGRGQHGRIIGSNGG